MDTNINLQPPTQISLAIEEGNINGRILQQFDNDIMLMYNKILELEARIKVLEGV